MSLKITLTLAGILLLAVIFASVNYKVGQSKGSAFVLGLSKVISEVAIALTIVFIPAVILLSNITPQPKNVMPSFQYEGAYSEVLSYDIDGSLIERLNAEMSKSVELFPTANNYFGRAYLYFKTNNMDLAYADLQECIKLEDSWMYYYDLGVVCGYLLDYSSSISFFEKALTMDMPLAKRGVAIETQNMIKGYWGEWIGSLFNK